MIRLIVADDSPHARHGLCAILATHPGVEIVGEASEGLEALALVEAKPPQVALMDVRMPVMDGMQATRLIKDRWPQVRVILISMYGDYRRAALESGADAFLVKGCPAEELVTAIVGPEPIQNIDPAGQSFSPDLVLEAIPGKPKEIPMNDNPWHVENMARAQRERVQEEMRQIHLEDAVLKRHAERRGLLVQVWLLVQRWLEARRQHTVQAKGVKQQTLQAAGTKHHVVV